MAFSFSPQILMLKMVAAINEEPNGWVPGIGLYARETSYTLSEIVTHEQLTGGPVPFRLQCYWVCFLRLVARFKIQEI